MIELKGRPLTQTRIQTTRSSDLVSSQEPKQGKTVVDGDEYEIAVGLDIQVVGW